MDPVTTPLPVLAASAAATLPGLVALHAALGRPAAGWLRLVFAFEAGGGLTLGLAIVAGRWTWQVGVPIWIAVVAVCGFALTASLALSRGGQPPVRRRTTAPPPARRASGRPAAAGAVLSAFAASGLVSAAAALALAAWLPASDVDATVGSVALWPVLWAALACRLYTVSSRRRAWAEATGLAVVSALALALTPAG